MKVKWTTITEDESTLPPYNERVLINTDDNDSSYPVVLKETIYGNSMANTNKSPDDRFFDDSLVYRPLNLYLGRQWRPMPKPPKLRESQKSSSSPWKPIKELNVFITDIVCLRKMMNNGMYSYLISSLAHKDNLINDGYNEYMEIPK